jgi:hypothetical protein
MTLPTSMPPVIQPGHIAQFTANPQSVSLDRDRDPVLATVVIKMTVVHPEVQPSIRSDTPDHPQIGGFVQGAEVVDLEPPARGSERRTGVHRDQRIAVAEHVHRGRLAAHVEHAGRRWMGGY